MRVLLVEDDDELRGFLRSGLQGEGYDVVEAATGPEGLAKAAASRFDAVILDRMLPGLDGLKILTAMRAARDRTPALVLTAKGGLADLDEVRAAGADDCIVKPFAMAEVIARLRSLSLQTASGFALTPVSVDDLTLDPEQRTVSRGCETVALESREFSLLLELMRHSDQTVTRKMLLERVWDMDFEPKTDFVTSLVKKLERKLASLKQPPSIEVTPGGQYRLSAS